jgi:single-strand DNA-binding protein
MSGSAALYGRLGADPVQRTSQAGKPWATATLAVDLGSGEDHDSPPQWFGVVAFGRAAEQLCRLSKGDLLSVSGRLQVNRWRDREGAEREQLQVIADSIVSAKTVRPGGGRRRDEGGGA